MKMTKTIAAAMALFATASVSYAAALNITVDENGDYLQNGAGPPPVPELSLASYAFYGIYQNPVGSTANDPLNNFDFLKNVVSNWNANNPVLDPDLPTPIYSIETAANIDTIGSGNLNANGTFTSATGYDYVVFHFGTGQAGMGGKPSALKEDENGWWAAWYLGGQSYTFTLPQEGDPLQPVGGFSSARYFNGTPTTVPDGGCTFLAFGVGLLGLGGVRRFLLKA